MLEHRAAVQEQLVQQQAEGLRRLNLDREQVLNRLWEIANLSPEMTRGSVTGQVKALSMIVAMENFIPDRRAVSSPEKTSTPPPGVGSRPQPLPQRMTRNQALPPITKKPSNKPGPARRQRRLRILAQANPPSPNPSSVPFQT
jgi:hypothetical protein